ncbi:MAG: hypothetical protein H6719_15130 [Sandaracinaceae bacterium]|nr:hypothetical protein [Sandaracinaceae bacterium]
MHGKHGFWIGLGLGLFFSLGFLTATAMAPTAEAQRNRQRWEYRTINHGWDQARWANEAGQQGWRFVGFEYGNAHKLLFERPL